MNENEATSPAKTGDANSTGTDGLTLAQAAAQLLANSKKPAAPQAEAPVAEETTPETPTETLEDDTPATEAQDDASAETDPEEPATADETTADEETEGEADEVLSPSQLDEKLRAKIHKRIGKEVAKRKVLETRIAELESKLNQQPTQPTQEPAPTTPPTPIAAPNAPLANIQDPAQLAQHRQLAKDALRWAEDTLENPRAWKTKTDLDPDTGEELSVRVTMIGKETYTEDQVRSIRREAKVTLEDHIPAREQFILARQQATVAAQEAYPWLKDKSSPEYQQAQAMLRDPWVRMRPDAEWIVATQIEGIKSLKARQEAAKAATKSKPKAPAARPSSDQAAVPATGSATSRISPDSAARAARQAEREKMMAKGGITAAEAASFLLRNRTRNSG